jgi:NTP pyrophosphatase (non-canonical NTP hydrolase)
MYFNNYQEKALSTAKYPNVGKNLIYPALGLGEVGEIQNKVKKVFRDDNGVLQKDRRDSLIDELGDLFWYIAVNAFELKLKMGDLINNDDASDAQRMIRETMSYKTNALAEASLELGCNVGDYQYLVLDLTQGGSTESFFMEEARESLAELLSTALALVSVLDADADTVLSKNIDKLQDRLKREVIKGDGDKR